MYGLKLLNSVCLTRYSIYLEFCVQSERHRTDEVEMGKSKYIILEDKYIGKAFASSAEGVRGPDIPNNLK